MGGAQASGLGGDQVVVAVVADVHDLLRAARGDLDNAAEEGGVRLGDSPLSRSSDEVCGQVQLAEDTAGLDGLVSGDAHPQAHLAQRGQRRPDIGVQVRLAVVFPCACFLPALALSGQVEAWLEVLEGLCVVPSGCGHRAQHRGEGVAGHPDPVCPCAKLPAVIEQRLTDVEDHRDHGHFRSPLPTPADRLCRTLIPARGWLPGPAGRSASTPRSSITRPRNQAPVVPPAGPDHGAQAVRFPGAGTLTPAEEPAKVVPTPPPPPARCPP